MSDQERVNSLFSKLQKATVVVSFDKQTPRATGFLISNKGYFITVGHALTKNPEHKPLSFEHEVWLCFDWKKGIDKSAWFSARPVACRYTNAIDQLDYAVLHAGISDEITQRTPLEICFKSENFISNYISVYGYDGTTNEMCYSPNVSLFAEGQTTLRLNSRGLKEGHSGSAVFHLNFGVIGICRAMDIVDIDTRIVVQMTNLIKDWPPFEEILENQKNLSRKLRADDFYKVIADNHNYANEIHHRIQALTSEELPEGLWRCKKAKEQAGAESFCGERHNFLWLIAELKRSKTVVARLTDIKSLIDRIFHHANYLHTYLDRDIYKDDPRSLDMDPIVSCIHELKDIFKEPLPGRKQDDDYNQLEAEHRLKHYLSNRCHLSMDDVEKFTNKLNSIIVMSTLIKERCNYGDIFNYTLDGFVEFISQKKAALLSLFEFDDRLSLGIDLTIKELVHVTKAKLIDGFKKEFLEEHFANNTSFAQLIERVILGLPHNKLTDETRNIKIWRQDINEYRQANC